MKATRLPNLVKIFSLIGVLVTISIDGFSDNKKDSLLHVVSSSTSDLTILNAYVELDSIYFNEKRRLSEPPFFITKMAFGLKFLYFFIL